MNQMITIGIMSGTSLDGVDAVALRFTRAASVQEETFETLGRASLEIPQRLRDELRALATGTTHEIERMGDASVALADLYTSVTEKLLSSCRLDRHDVAALGIHGQTIRHRPERGFTVQLNHPARVAEKIGIPVIADFRSRDVAAGGEGAPLVPAFHAHVFATAEPRAVLNIGGIANLTLLPGKAEKGLVLGFDTGPGNMLLDHWMHVKFGVNLDRNGTVAASGHVLPKLLAAFLDEPYFAASFPKSTGRERFSPEWLDKKLALTGTVNAAPNDVAATLVELTAHSIASALQASHPQCKRLFVCGGGTLNPYLMTRLRSALWGLPEFSTLPVEDSSVAGIDPMAVEGAAFAWLARSFLAGEPGNLPTVTRATGPRILGALYPA